jgi:transmembrane sensor
MNNNDRINYLVDRYINGILSSEEHDELFEQISSGKFDDLLGLRIMQDLHLADADKDADLPPHVAQEIIRNIYQAEKNTADIIPIKKRRTIGWKWIAAASVIFLIASSAAYLYFPKRSDQETFAAIVPDNITTHTNNTTLPEDLALADGSHILLSPQSKIHFPRLFSDDKREVYLEGEAFFEIAKNPQKPFFVYYNNIVTKVLGTSFTINTNKKTGNIEVAVKTGKVQVYENEKLVEYRKAEAAVIITPNQKAIYQKDSRLFETALVDQPQTLQDLQRSTWDSVITGNEKFVYDQEPLNNVFRHIEASYGIEIVTENSATNNCIFTGDVSSNDLYTKLNIICLTVNASYEINGTRILIKGKGCN